ncbi:CDGSH iron-sulfur domain-containing protein 2 homolog [Anoplophora glabripennis]|uniref:CDGSH iron-sulfur domain-containing protein 2 homolog n=1 Tax=Anoplophora glabripennis TaxID=217634 RepID=UPI000874B3AC|nr:CDGSH iron-sulfur domain-containing protein 2 homolog [Anoplophora glabripennis]
MKPVAYVVKDAVPNYLSSLPIPDTFGGWFRLGFKDWLALVPPTAVAAGFSYVVYRAFCPHGRPAASGKINPCILKTSNKVVDSVDVEDITDKAVFCRCWRSKNWPYCDGSHGNHNKETGDNVGPIIVQRKKN